MKHNLRNTRIYTTWASMKGRCYCTTSSSYYKYGAKGISICDEWRYSFLNFYSWAMQNGYDDSLSIDRINPEGNYEPLNCRFVDKYVQARNTRAINSKNTSGFRGVTFRKKTNKYISQISICKNKKHIGCFNTAIEAAIAYNNYVIKNKLEHTLNII